MEPETPGKTQCDTEAGETQGKTGDAAFPRRHAAGGTVPLAGQDGRLSALPRASTDR